MGKNKALETLCLFRAPRSGALVLSCEKCHRKLAENGLQPLAATLDAAVTTAAAQTPGTRLRRSPCLGECPSDGVTVCALVAGAFTLPQPVVLRGEADVARFFLREIGPATPHPDPVVSEAGIEPATVSLEG